MELDEIARANQRQLFLKSEGLDSYSPREMEPISQLHKWEPRVIPKRRKPFMNTYGWTAYVLGVGSIVCGISLSSPRPGVVEEKVEPVYIAPVEEIDPYILTTR